MEIKVQGTIESTRCEVGVTITAKGNGGGGTGEGGRIERIGRVFVTIVPPPKLKKRNHIATPQPLRGSSVSKKISLMQASCSRVDISEQINRSEGHLGNFRLDPTQRGMRGGGGERCMP